MIPNIPMYRELLRKSWKRALLITIGVAVNSAVVISWRTGWSNLPSQLFYQMIVAFCVGSLFWLGAPLNHLLYGRLRPIPLWTVRIIGAVFALNFGITIGLAILGVIGVFSWEFYWSVLRDSVVPTTFIGVLCFVGFTLYDTLKYRAQYETAQARLSSLESRLRPHFLFNTLNSIMALIPEDPAAAERVTERLAALLRYSLDNTGQSTVRLEQELKVATDYLEIEKTRFGDRLHYSIDVPQELMQVQVPPFSLQTLVENSVKYGGGEIRVNARNGNGRITLRVWDSGEGFPHEAKLPAGHGLHNLKERLDTLWGDKAAVGFPREEEGTTVEISIPR